VLSTAENRGAKFSGGGLATLVRRSEGDDRLATCVGSRPEIPPHLLLALLLKASRSVRLKLEAAHPGARRAVREVVAEVTAGMAGGSPSPAVARAYVEALDRRGRLEDKKLEALAKVGRCGEITTALAVLSGLPLDFVEQSMKQESAEMILIIAKAIALPWTTVKAILSARAGGRPILAGELAQCLASYERLEVTTAHEIVRFHRLRDHSDTRPPT
jgi:hypothetical protein